MLEDSTPDVENTQRVGKRLAQIREELMKKYGEEWSQKGLAQKTKLTQNIISRLERGEGGRIGSWILIICIYEKMGYNPTWILAEKNELITKFQIAEATATSEIIEELLARVNEHRDAIGEEVENLRELLRKKKA